MPKFVLCLIFPLVVSACAKNSIRQTSHRPTQDSAIEQPKVTHLASLSRKIMRKQELVRLYKNSVEEYPFQIRQLEMELQLLRWERSQLQAKQSKNP